MTKQQLAIDLIKEHTGKDGKCTVSKSMLGKILYDKYRTEFTSPEQARKVVRNATGSNGEMKRKQNKTVTEWKGLALPEPEKNDYSKFLIREKRIGILSDIHFPYYDKEALNAAIGYLRKWKPDCILLNGDIIDCYQLSDYVTDPKQRDFQYELDMLRSFVQELRKIWPHQRIVYKIGNHEERYETKILKRVPQFVNLRMLTIQSVLNVGDLGVEVVTNKRIIKAGKVNILHAHELPRGMAAPVNPARGFFLRCKANVIGSHHHQSSEHFEQDLNGQIIGAWSLGHLGDPHPHYCPINKWNHGFATLENYGTDFKVDNLKIIKGKVM